ncbi:galactokinase [Nitrospira moscoviensis]|uniref:Galactokinase n=1 Tax=Nitrospira moscoviensis TaxID=42253 RepID=A0A0K2GEE7_NITMO|nr:galactokinase [Nitrospira moscoviensis]ALA59234.1 Galactokinase [Nitrospira moscoviensis]
MSHHATTAHDIAAYPDFTQLFHRLPDALAYAPGRVNLMGDHTDYNGGYVLPMPLPQETHVEVALRQDRTVRVWSGNVEPAQAHRDYRLGEERRRQDWVDYVQAATAALARGTHALSGMDVRVVSSVPPGAGLASSAALLVALLHAMRNALRLDVSDADVARLAHLAETEFVGAPVGIMDQMVCALGRPGSAFFLDTATLAYEHVPLPPSAEWIVIHSGVRHSHQTGSYPERRRECEAACALLGLRSMRDLEGAGRQEVLSRIAELPPPLDARARHVVTENDRVLAGVELLQDGNMRGFGALMKASHESLRHDYAVSVPETDLLVELADAEEAVYGARLTGGGFGGSVVIAAQAGAGRQVAGRIAERYRGHCGREAAVLLP